MVQVDTYSAILTMRTTSRYDAWYTAAFTYFVGIGIMPIEETANSLRMIFLDPQETYAVWEYARAHGYSLSLESLK